MDAAVPPPDSATAESPADKPKPQKLRFKTLRGKAHPHGFLLIDRALDRLGCQLYGDKWRYCPQLKDLPYQHRKENEEWTAGFFSFHYEWKRNRWHLKRDPITVSKEDRPAYRQAGAMFAKAVERLRAALYEGELSAHRHSITLDQIESSHKGIWTKKSIPIFYTGQLYEEGVRNKEKILISRDRFEQWVLQQSLQPIIPASAKIEADLDALKKVIEEHVGGKEYKLYREGFTAGVAGVFTKCRIKSPAVTAGKLFTKLDRTVGMKRGHPIGGSPEPTQEDMSNLLRVINEECLRQRGGTNQHEVAGSEL
jgi:hypothetical protein